METNTQKLIHSFGALADLGQEIADSADFMEMVRTSLHLLLGTLAIRRGAVLEVPVHLERTNCLATWGLSPDYGVDYLIDAATKEALVNSVEGVIKVDEDDAAHRYHALQGLRTQEIELIIPMAVHGQLTGLVALGGKASGEPFSPDDLEVVQAMVRHIGVGIHTHRVLAEVK
ncbi:MAG TPA: GAF domain-containing protein, partial [Pyrinomonadaceae bacterium]|nr:GAF domain-containing protein [Pyrinomonadaceae bacterium]